jgi:phosphatidate cytidylyltransferase
VRSSHPYDAISSCAHPYISPRAEPQKPSKSALKKAARAARLEKKQQERTAAKLLREASANSSQPTSSPLLGTLEHPLELSETDSPSVGDASLPDTTHPGAINGEIDHSESPTLDSTREPEPEPKPVAASFIPEPSERKVEEDRPVQQPEITVVPAPEIVLQPAAATTTSQADNPERKRQNILTRTLWTFIMLGGFIGMSHLFACDFPLISVCSAAPAWSRIHDPARYALSNGSLPRGYCSLFHQEH